MPDRRADLAAPSEALEAAYWEYVADFATAGEQTQPGGSMKAGESYAQYMQRLRDNARGVDLPEGYVPGTTFWLMAAGRMVGQCNLRHRLSEPLMDFGGHVGYSIRPSDRRKGYGTLQLRLALEEAKGLGIPRVRITCDSDNVASVRVIEANGGVLDSESFSQRSGHITRRYWIDLNVRIR